MGIRGRKLSNDEEALVCSRYINGYSLKYIQSLVGISITSVMAVLRRNAVPLRNGKRLLPEQESVVVRLYKAGESIAQIKVDSGVKSEQTIYRILRDAGIEQRKKRKAAE